MEGREAKLREAIKAALCVLTDQVMADPERTPQEAIDELLGILDNEEIVMALEERAARPSLSEGHAC
jgi:hypothetical protein